MMSSVESTPTGCCWRGSITTRGRPDRVEPYIQIPARPTAPFGISAGTQDVTEIDDAALQSAEARAREGAASARSLGIAASPPPGAGEDSSPRRSSRSRPRQCQRDRDRITRAQWAGLAAAGERVSRGAQARRPYGRHRAVGKGGAIAQRAAPRAGCRTGLIRARPPGARGRRLREGSASEHGGDVKGRDDPLGMPARRIDHDQVLHRCSAISRAAVSMESPARTARSSVCAPGPRSAPGRA